MFTVCTSADIVSRKPCAMCSYFKVTPNPANIVINFAVICISSSVYNVCTCSCTSAACFYWPTPLQYVVESQKMLYMPLFGFNVSLGVQNVAPAFICGAARSIFFFKEKKRKKSKMTHRGRHLSLQLLSGWSVVWTQQQPAVCLWLCLAVFCCRS